MTTEHDMLDFFLGREFPEPPPADDLVHRALATPWVAFAVMLDRSLKQRLVGGSGFSPTEIENHVRGTVIRHLDQLLNDGLLTERDHRLLSLLAEASLDAGLRSAFQIMSESESRACLAGVCPPPVAAGDPPPPSDLQAIRQVSADSIARLAVYRASLGIRDESADVRIGDAVVQAVQSLLGRSVESMSLRVRLAALGLWEWSDQGDSLMEDIFEVFEAMGLLVDRPALEAATAALRNGRVESLEENLRFKTPLELDERTVTACPEARKMLHRYRVILRKELIAAEEEFGAMLQGGSDGWVQLVYTAAIGGSLVAQEALREVVASGDGQRAAAFDWCMAHRTSELTTGAMEAVVMREMGPESTGSFSSLFADLLRHEIVHGESDLARHLRPTGYEDWYRAACAAYRTDGLAGVESLGIDVSGGPVTAGNLSPQGPLGKYRELLSQHHRDAAMRASEEAAHQRGLGWFVACVDAYDIDPGIFKGVERTADADDVAQIMAASQLRANGEAGWWDRGLDVGRTTRLLVAASRVGIQVRPDLDRQLTRHLEHFRSLGVGGDGGQIDEALEQCVDHLRGRAGGVDATLLDRFLRLDPQGFAAAAVKEFVDIPLSRGRLRLLGIPTVVMIVLTFGLLLMIGGRYIGRDFAPRGLAPESSPAKVPEGVALALDSEGWQAWGRRWTRLVDLKDVDRLLGLTVLPERPKAGDQLVVDRRIARELKERMNWILRGRSAFGVKYEEEILEWPRLEMRLPRSSELNDGVFGIFEDRPWSEESMPERGVRRPVLLVLEVRQ